VTGYDVGVDTLRSRAASVLIGLATALVIVAVVLPLFMTSWWVAFEQDRAQATAWTGFTQPELRQASDAILTDLITGPPDFDVMVRGEPVLDERERGHMRDVREVFIAFYRVALILAVVAVAIAVRRHGPDRARSWRAVRGGALALIVVFVVGGLVSVVAFDALFEVFHRLLFAGGTYTFDPATERLVQLFPFQFWQETAIVVGAVSIVLAVVVAAIAHARAASAARVSTPMAATTMPSLPAAGSSR
jgi:integral membrane protein (TIGR01906 family)